MPTAYALLQESTAAGFQRMPTSCDPVRRLQEIGIPGVWFGMCFCSAVGQTVKGLKLPGFRFGQDNLKSLQRWLIAGRDRVVHFDRLMFGR